MNNVTLIGRLTKAPEMAYTKNSNTAVTTFTLAVDKRRRDDGANFIRVKCFGKTAENVDRYLDKGRQAGVTGAIDTYSYEKDGRTINGFEIIADHVEFLGGNAEPKAEEPSNNVAFAEIDTPDSFEMATDDIPF